MNDKFFKVTAVCGHVGRKNGLLKDFALNTNSAEDAAKIARGLPRVKHHNKKAIRQVVEITREACSIESFLPFIIAYSKTILLPVLSK